MKKSSISATSASKKTTKLLGKMLADRVLVKESPADEMSAGGIIIPDNAKEKPNRGTVILVGRGKNVNEPTELNEGDVVLYGKYAGIEVKIKGIDYLIMREADILMVLPD